MRESDGLLPYRNINIKKKEKYRIYGDKIATEQPKLTIETIRHVPPKNRQTRR